MLLEVRDLHVEFHTREGGQGRQRVTLVAEGETLAVLGESGSGKSVTAQAVMGILDMPPGKITGGEILFKGQDLLKLKPEERRKIRGQEMAMIFQDALSSLNPPLRRPSSREMFVVHCGMSRKDARAKSVELMGPGPHPRRQGAGRQLPAPVLRRHAPAHHDRHGDGSRLSLIIADEPTTALDATSRPRSRTCSPSSSAS
ncbi:ABC transporter ATP-binding protein OS=Streptomyces microflavus OX=1919 GN=Smic_54440 PE=3 SV=1 [Streptomyces microflavus]